MKSNIAAIAATTLLVLPATASAVDYIEECELADEGATCFDGTYWGICFEAGPNSCAGENPDFPGECRGYPSCDVEFCPGDAAAGDACAINGNPGSCVFDCDLNPDLVCSGDDDLVCELDDGALGDDEAACSAAGGATAPGSLLLALGALLFSRRPKRRSGRG